MPVSIKTYLGANPVLYIIRQQVAQLAAARGQAKVIAASVTGLSVQSESCTESPGTTPGMPVNTTRKAIEAETGLSKATVNRKLAQARSEAAIDLGAPARRRVSDHGAGRGQGTAG